MNIGIDFDNTIVCYDNVFYKAALRYGFKMLNVKKDKNSVKEFIQNNYHHDDFTILQGYVYGKCMNLATLYVGLKKFIISSLKNNFKVFIISHKTKYPILGKQYNLHQEAMNFLIKNKIVDSDLIIKKNVFFEKSKEKKIKRISELNLDFFIDDLPDIIDHENFPENTKNIYFDPNKENIAKNYDFRAVNWNEINNFVNKTPGKSVDKLE